MIIGIYLEADLFMFYNLELFWTFWKTTFLVEFTILVVDSIKISSKLNLQRNPLEAMPFGSLMKAKLGLFREGFIWKKKVVNFHN